MTTAPASRLDRAVRLFEFLARAQQSTISAPRTYDGYDLAWSRDLPRHAAVHFAHWDVEPEPGDEIGHIDRLDRIHPPTPGHELARWLSGGVDDPDVVPHLATEIPDLEADMADPEGDDDVPAAAVLRLDDHPKVEVAYQNWLSGWTSWAERERVDRPVREAYAVLFSMQADAASNPEEKELVLAVGCLSWKPDGHPAVRRHLITTPVAIDLDPVTGTLHVNAVESPDPLRLELDMLDSQLTSSRHIADVRESARTYAEHPLNLTAIGELLQRVAHSLDPDASYVETESPGRGTPVTAEVALAPAVVLRRRNHGLAEVLERIREQLIDSQTVPSGILPLVDPDYRPPSETDPTPGALVAVDDEMYLPLPVNEKQLQVLRQVDRHAQTLVQGPPGTGKTHTAAALLSHLLAQGKRVLVTAQTDRALKEVRAKLPEAIRPLSVAVVGASREDMADLKVAVNTISQQAIDFDEQRSAQSITSHADAIDELRRQRAELHRRIVDVRSAEVTHHEQGRYRGTIAAIASAHHADEPGYGWISAWAPPRPTEKASLTTQEIVEWLQLLRDELLVADEEQARDTLPDPTTLTSSAEFAGAVAAETRARAADAEYVGHRQHSAFNAIRAMPATERVELQQSLHRLAGTADDLARRSEAWMSEALTDVISDRGQIWQERARQLQDLVDQAKPHVQRLGIAEVAATGPELAPLVSLAQHLRQHLSSGGKIKVAADGSPTLGVLTARPVKAARDLFAHVRVDGHPPATVEALDRFLAWAEATRLLSGLDRAWPATVRIPPEDTPQERLSWHVTELGQLHRVLSLGAALSEQDRRLVALRLPRPQWADVIAVRAYASLVDAADAEDRLNRARAAVEAAAEAATRLVHEPFAAPVLITLEKAVTDRDVATYASAVHRVQRLVQVRGMVRRRDELASRLRHDAPRLHDAIVADPGDHAWEGRLTAWEGAWAWAVTAAWIADRQVADLNRLQAETSETERQIRHHVEELAAARAWRHAAAPQRISGSARANLQQYGQLVRRLGKGTGKYAPQRRAEIRQAMDRCRPSVPVWIMPIYRIAEQLQVRPDMFDVVVVDEASQAGLAATFLQYLAPKIVVIGDDKQVSPSAVGVDQQHLRNLAAQYLHDDPYRASWQDPQRSLFDEAKMRFSGLIPLTEHRRCVPEIINFSNRIAYEPENIRLIPVRQYGADRLEPIKPVFVEDGYVRGTTGKINQPEAEAVVERIVACSADPRYDGRTFGVISLQGPHQAKLIERLLLERLDPAEWERRELRCGDSADFQGSERDVMFLSMVAAMEPGARMFSATAEMYVQRYNVAASRAKDQMWVFHSIRPSDLGNPADLRHQLLDYCYGVANRPVEHDGVVLPTDVPEDRRVVPFDSLFEQRVYNRIVGHGYTVVPQYEALGYSIDLVVVGPHSRLAVECDGDAWHGPDRYEADMARQRELERCGWEFFRIPQSAFAVDEAAVLQELWAALNRRGIRPAGAAEPDAPADDAPASLSELPPPAAPTGDVEETVASPWSGSGIGTSRTVTQARTSSAQEPGADVVTYTERPAASPPQAFAFAPVVVEASDPAVADTSGYYASAARAEPSLLEPYEAFEGSAPRAAEPAPLGMREAVLAIVACEGPMLGERLQTAYVRAAGGQRVGRAAASAVNKVISSAVRRGLLVEENPLREAGVQPRTYRLPHQPPAVPRVLGPRALDEVPPAELAVVMAVHAEDLGWSNPEHVYRATLQTYGRKALTEVAAVRLAKVASLARALTDES
ncbi:very-short-patch-repair endonuclease [Micromonospora luteifusca]|uniref:Very-short-patch-repair endonuclease n=1 Tax=Micromonospora luteifusca TaxID=709860 RepID=A0ABS2LNA4_9ACTN|nr:AAA domain-containing protein [Micromonospora luteifusca]MBM7489139.1 very-short-patch-repair endonuclease [Micromonospora luteifusca]